MWFVFLWPPDLHQATIEGHKWRNRHSWPHKGAWDETGVVQERSEPILGHDQKTGSAYQPGPQG